MANIQKIERQTALTTTNSEYVRLVTQISDLWDGAREQAFISKVEQEVVRRGFATYNELRTAVYNSLVDYLSPGKSNRAAPKSVRPWAKKVTKRIPKVTKHV